MRGNVERVVPRREGVARSRSLWLTVAVVALGITGTRPCIAEGMPTGPYLGQTPPGQTPEVFAPGIISLEGRFEYGIVFSPDVTECVFGLTNVGWSLFNLRYTAMDGGGAWSDPVPAPFQGMGDALSPAFTSDGETIFFASARPSYPPGNIWTSTRDGSGGWLAPEMLPAPVNSSDDEWSPSLTDDGVMYFVSLRPGGFGDADIYRAVPEGGVYTTVENIGPAINTSALESTPFIAPDESYLILESDRPGGFGQMDLYISYRMHGAWTTPENLGDSINTEQIEDEPYITPDGQYFFFNRRQSFVTAVSTDLWWVDITAVFGPVGTPEHGSHAASHPRPVAWNAPNPFYPATEITYSLPSLGEVTIDVLDVGGRRVLSLSEGIRAPGTHSVRLEANRTRGLASGTYFYRVRLADDVLTTGRMVLAR